MTYTCDCCKIVAPLEELESVQVYVFNTDGDDPKYFDCEFTCPKCREELIDLFDKWLKAKQEKSEIPAA